MITSAFEAFNCKKDWPAWLLLNRVANKNCKNIEQWTDEHPEYQIFDSPENMEYVKLTQAVLGGLGEQESKQFRDKIVRNVIKEVMINKC